MSEYFSAKVFVFFYFSHRSQGYFAIMGRCRAHILTIYPRSGVQTSTRVTRLHFLILIYFTVFEYLFSVNIYSLLPCCTFSRYMGSFGPISSMDILPRNKLSSPNVKLRLSNFTLSLGRLRQQLKTRRTNFESSNILQ